MSKIYTPYNALFTLLVLILCGIMVNCTAEEISSLSSNPVIVKDGDSLEIGNRRIRLMGIDAPEYQQYCKNAAKHKYPCGRVARDYLEKLINGEEINCKIHKKDQYNRDLCTCYKGSININKAMVEAGYAIIYLESPYYKEQQIAKENKRGIWQGRFMQPRLYARLKEQQKLN